MVTVPGDWFGPIPPEHDPRGLVTHFLPATVYFSNKSRCLIAKQLWHSAALMFLHDMAGWTSLAGVSDTWMYIASWQLFRQADLPWV